MKTGIAINVCPVDIDVARIEEKQRDKKAALIARTMQRSLSRMLQESVSSGCFFSQQPRTSCVLDKAPDSIKTLAIPKFPPRHATKGVRFDEIVMKNTTYPNVKL